MGYLRYMDDGLLFVGNEPAENCRSSYRNRNDSGNRDTKLGFRLASTSHSPDGCRLRLASLCTRLVQPCRALAGIFPLYLFLAEPLPPRLRHAVEGTSRLHAKGRTWPQRSAASQGPGGGSPSGAADALAGDAQVDAGLGQALLACLLAIAYQRLNRDRSKWVRGMAIR